MFVKRESHSAVRIMSVSNSIFGYCGKLPAKAKYRELDGERRPAGARKCRQSTSVWMSPSPAPAQLHQLKNHAGTHSIPSGKRLTSHFEV
jgi:hypothetical protein